MVMRTLLAYGETVQVRVVYREILIVALQHPRGCPLHAQLADVVPPASEELLVRKLLVKNLLVKELLVKELLVKDLLVKKLLVNKLKNLLVKNLLFFLY